MPTIKLSDKECEWLIAEIEAIGEFVDDPEAHRKDGDLLKSVRSKLYAASIKNNLSKITRGLTPRASDGAYCVCKTPWPSKITNRCAVCGLLVRPRA